MLEAKRTGQTREIAPYKRIEAKGHTWCYLEYGNPQGQPILNIHGWLGSTAEGEDRLSRAFTGEPQNSEALQKLAEHNQESAAFLVDRIKGLGGKYHVVAPALPGFGTTAPLTGDVSLARIADELYEFQKATHTESAIVFGTSMGGIVATKLATRYPDSTKLLALQGTMTRPKDLNLFYYTATRIAGVVRVSEWMETSELPRTIAIWLFKTFDRDFKLADAEDQERMIKTMFRGDKKTSVATFQEIGNDIGEDINQIACPVVVLDGAHAQMVPIMKSHEVAKRFPTQTIFLPIGGRAGVLGHALINRFPEGVATWVDYVYNKVEEQRTV